jgi:hypothetical protein
VDALRDPAPAHDRGRLQRQFESRLTLLTSGIRETLVVAKRLFEQIAPCTTKTPKLHSSKAPEELCSNKSSAKTLHEFRVKLGIAKTLPSSLILHARIFNGKPYADHVHAEQIEHASILQRATGNNPRAVWFYLGYLGYLGMDDGNPGLQIKHSGKAKRLNRLELRTVKRRQAIEPLIAELKGAHGMRRCNPQALLVEKIHAVLCAARRSIRWLIPRGIVQNGLRALLRPLRASAAIAVWR